MLEAGAEHDRKGERVTYGSFVRLMGRTTKVLVREGEWVMREGDAVRDFYGLLSGQAPPRRHLARSPLGLSFHGLLSGQVDVVRTRKGQPDQARRGLAPQAAPGCTPCLATPPHLWLATPPYLATPPDPATQPLLATSP